MSPARHRAGAPALRRHRLLAVGVAVVLLGAAAWPAYRYFRPDLESCEPRGPVATVAGYAGTMTGDGPWTRNCATLPLRLAALKLPPYDPEEKVHRHTHLDLFVDGKRVTVPAGIGLDEGDTPLSPVHTHNPDGVVHVESPAERTFTLADFFAVWGLRTAEGCLGGHCPAGDKALHVYVDGQEVPADLAAVPLTDRTEVTVSFGTPAQVMEHVVTGFEDWPPT